MEALEMSSEEGKEQLEPEKDNKKESADRIPGESDIPPMGKWNAKADTRVRWAGDSQMYAYEGKMDELDPNEKRMRFDLSTGEKMAQTNARHVRSKGGVQYMYIIDINWKNEGSAFTNQRLHINPSSANRVSIRSKR